MSCTMRLVFLAAVALLSTDAQADCKPLLDAMGKLAQQSRIAAYEVDRPDQPLSGEPDVVIIGQFSYVRTGTEWERIEIGDAAKDGGWSWSALPKEIAAGRVRCSAAGGGTLRGAAVAKFKYEVFEAGKVESSGSVWIERRSGLPVFEGPTGDTGWVVLYGDLVKEPKVRK